MSFPLGIDISAYQFSSDGKQKPNFDTINATCDFVAMLMAIFTATHLAQSKGFMFGYGGTGYETYHRH